MWGRALTLHATITITTCSSWHGAKKRRDLMTGCTVVSWSGRAIEKETKKRRRKVICGSDASSGKRANDSQTAKTTVEPVPSHVTVNVRQLQIRFCPLLIFHRPPGSYHRRQLSLSNWLSLSLLPLPSVSGLNLNIASCQKPSSSSLSIRRIVRLDVPRRWGLS